MKINEMYDILDNSYRIIGQASWTEVHNRGLLHQNVHGILFRNKQKTETLIKRRSKQMVQAPGLLEISVAGHVVSGKTPESTIRKELEEELLGKSVPNNCLIKKVGSYLHSDMPNNNELISFYEIIYPGPFITDEESEGKPQWVNFQELINEIKTHPENFAQYSINALIEYVKLRG